jgi:hypothetical protein
MVFCIVLVGHNTGGSEVADSNSSTGEPEQM